MSDEEIEMSGFWALPEGCMSTIISFTSPKDACVGSAVSLGFKSAADSDIVWERFLPCDYQNIIARSVSPVDYSSKKELYFRLCDFPLLLDGGKLSLTLNKSSGNKCYMLCARELSITWGDTPVYWNWKSLPESRFAEVAELLAVCWLHIRGKLQTQMLSLKTNYAAYLVFKLHQNCYGLNTSSKASVKLVQESTPEDEGHKRIVYLKNPLHARTRYVRRRPLNIEDRIPKQRRDGWIEIELGQYYNDGRDEGNVQMQLQEIERLNWKGGLIVEGIELRPKEG